MTFHYRHLNDTLLALNHVPFHCCIVISDTPIRNCLSGYTYRFDYLKQHVQLTIKREKTIYM